MAVLYKPTKFDTPVDPNSLTEQEHKESCDINIMVKSALRGQQIRGGKNPEFGYDDTTMSGLELRIQKQNLEEQLSSGEKEFEESIFNSIPQVIREKFGFKIKQTTIPAQKNDDSNDEKKEPTTKTQNP